MVGRWGGVPNRNLNFLIIIVSEGRDATTHLSLNRSAPEFVLCLVRVAWLSSAPPFLGDFDNDTAPSCHQPHYSHKL